MYKEEFSKHIAQQYNITQKAAHDVIDTFTSRGHNPRTGLALDIPAYNKPRFKVGKKLKDACNK